MSTEERNVNEPMEEALSGLGQGRQPPSRRRAGEEGGGLALSRGNF